MTLFEHPVKRLQHEPVAADHYQGLRVVGVSPLIAAAERFLSRLSSIGGGGKQPDPRPGEVAVAGGGPGDRCGHSAHHRHFDRQRHCPVTGRG